MDTIDIQELRECYRYYRFSEIKTGSQSIMAFKHSLYFKNADIVPLNNSITDDQLENIKTQLEKIGLTCKLNKFRRIDDIQSDLFKGFFNWDETIQSIQGTYNEFIEKRRNVIGETYSYIPSAFVSDSNITASGSDPVEFITSAIQNPGPQLILIEAPAGYGKTTAMHELTHRIAENTNSTFIPLLAELHRNRKVPEFKYVLLDEFNRVFNGIEYALAIRHIQRGELILIIDGFDEMIRNGSSKKTTATSADSINEPLLYTLSEIVKSNAKVILTTRKTVFSEKDYFQKWYDSCKQECNITRVVIQNPSVENWLGKKRVIRAVSKQVELEKIANPILLANLKKMSDTEYDAALDNPGLVIDRFVDELMTREIERQDLRIESVEQKAIFTNLSRSFCDFDITEESKEFIASLICENPSSINIVKESLKKYWTKDGTATIDQILEKLTLHCVLDKRGFSSGISFVSDFLFGYFLGNDALNNTDRAILLEDSLDIITQTYSVFDASTRNMLWEVIQDCLSAHDTPIRVTADLRLKGKVMRSLSDCNLEGFDFYDDQYDGTISHNVQFISCRFHDISFLATDTVECNFVGCEFYGCGWEGDVLGNNFIKTNWTPQTVSTITPSQVSDSKNIQRRILERFWPRGRANFQTCKKKSTLFCGIPPHYGNKINDEIDELVHQEILSPSSGGLYWLNLEKIETIKSILGVQ